MKTMIFGRVVVFACSLRTIEKDHIFKSFGISLSMCLVKQISMFQMLIFNIFRSKF